jgi:hypothetical protein
VEVSGINGSIWFGFSFGALIGAALDLDEVESVDVCSVWVRFGCGRGQDWVVSWMWRWRCVRAVVSGEFS